MLSQTWPQVSAQDPEKCVSFSPETLSPGISKQNLHDLAGGKRLQLLSLATGLAPHHTEQGTWPHVIGTACLSSAARAKRMIWDRLVTPDLCHMALTAQALLSALAQPCPAGISEAPSHSAGHPTPFTCSNEEGTSSGSLKFFTLLLAKLSTCHLFCSSTSGANASCFSCFHTLCSPYFIFSITADAC